MSKERISYKEVSIIFRLVALVIDIVVGIILAFLLQFGALLEWDLLWTAILPNAAELEPFLDYLVIVWFIIFFPVYHFLISALTDGQTVGKMILGIKVVTVENESTKRQFKLHLRRFFFMKGGTKVVKEIDPGVAGL